MARSRMPHHRMAWTKPQFSHSQVDLAGKILIAPEPDDIFEAADLTDRKIEALDVINNWRSSHSRPLQTLKMILRDRAKRVESDALVAQRIKRIPAIDLKLRNNSHMQLSKMHDIGGCRAVLKTVSHVEELLRAYEEATAKNPRRGGVFVKKYDYIASPKPSGYRSVHLVYKYYTDSKKLMCYSGLRIELQLRSKIQHAWATAVEAVDAFTRQALKSNIGEDAWKRFFALTSSAFALLEKRPTVPGTPSDVDGLKSALKEFNHEIALLAGFQTATQMIGKKTGNVFLLKLDSEKRVLRTTAYPQESLGQAQTDYIEMEKSTKDNPQIQVVLVSADSLKSLRKAYPNYFLDITEFLTLINRFLAP